MSKWKKNRDEIIWNVINSILAGSLVFLGSFMSTGDITRQALIASSITSAVVIITKLSAYISSEESEYKTTSKLFNFVR